MVYLARYGDEHELFSRPYMEMIRGYSEFRFLILGPFFWLDLELAPQGVDVLLLVIHPRIFHQMVPNGGVGTVSPYHEIERDFNFIRSSR